MDLAARLRVVPVGEIDGRRRRLAEGVVERVADDAGDDVNGPPRARIWRPSGSPLGDVAADELLVDDRLPWRGGVGERREVASRH